MSAEIIAFPFKVSAGMDQQRWIPAPRARQRAARPNAAWLRLAGFLGAALSSWVLVIGTVRLIAQFV
jgi:hypothetical protein